MLTNGIILTISICDTLRRPRLDHIFIRLGPAPPTRPSLPGLPARTSMSRKNRRLVADEPVEFEKQTVEARDFRRITNHFRGIYGTYLKWMKPSKSEDVNMYPARFRITRVLTNYAQKFPRHWRTCMGTPPRWKPMWQYPVKWRSSFTCWRRLMPQVTGYCHIGSQRGGVPTQCGQEDQAVKEAWEG